jgi:hypothetical protein
MLRAVLAQLPDSAISACVVLPGGPPSFWYDPDASLLGELRTTSRSVEQASECPPTDDLMVVYRDSSGKDATPRRPPGYVDPYWVRVQEQRLVGRDSAFAVVRASQGTLNRGFVCGARHRDARWEANCRYAGLSISRSLPDELPAAKRDGGPYREGHAATLPHETPSPALRREIARWVLFLHFDSEYAWPWFPFISVRTPRWLNRRQDEAFARWAALGDYGAWPFQAAHQVSAAAAQPRYRRGARA